MTGVLWACHEECGKKSGSRSKGDACWWNEDVKKEISRMKNAHKAVCRNSTVENKNKYKSMKNKA